MEAASYLAAYSTDMWNMKEINMDPELIKHYAYELHWHLPEEMQQRAIEWLTVNTPHDRLHSCSHLTPKAAGKMR